MNELTVSGPPPIDRDDQTALLNVARASIRHGLERGRALSVPLGDYPGVLAEPGACFVSLHRDGKLRGCIGSTEATRPLVMDAAENAYAAAFRDHRFSPLAVAEFPGLVLSLHILTAPEPLPFNDLPDLHARLRLGQDGLILQLGNRRAVYLPVVWQQTPDPRQFVTQLLRKAGIADGEPLEDLTAQRFEEFEIKE